jgi:hypothetical protein
MNRRNFFTMAALSAAAIVANKAAAFLKPTGYAPIAAPPVLSYPPPLTPQEKFQGAMLTGHSHSINDPGHSHSILDFEPLPLRTNPNWIPCDEDPNWRRWYRDGNSWQLL